MRIGIVTVAYNLAGATQRLVKSIKSDKHEVVIQLFLHSQQPAVVGVCKELEATDERVVYWAYGVNRGLSKSWNDGINACFFGLGCDVVIVVNDDVKFGEGDVDTLAEFASQHDGAVCPAWGWHHRHEKRQSIGFSCFAITPKVWQEVGGFDENIFPIYFEDCDYIHRMKLAGLEIIDCQATSVEHAGSESINSDPELSKQNGITFRSNQLYYHLKWGGMPGHEQYKHPFDDARFGYRIDTFATKAPYEGYNRTDFDIVRI